MAQEDITLRWQFPSAEEHRDIRSFNIYTDKKNSPNLLHTYKFQHISTGTTNSVTTFQRLNTSTGVWEIAGEIAWLSDANANIQFGAAARIHVKELRQRKKATSKSRRFKAGGSEYKWKIAENNTDLYCVDSRGKVITTWTQQSQMMHINQRAEGILDRLVVTCLLHIWFRMKSQW